MYRKAECHCTCEKPVQHSRRLPQVQHGAAIVSRHHRHRQIVMSWHLSSLVISWPGCISCSSQEAGRLGAPTDADWASILSTFFRHFFVIFSSFFWWCFRISGGPIWWDSPRPADLIGWAKAGCPTAEKPGKKRKADEEGEAWSASPFFDSIL